MASEPALCRIQLFGSLQISQQQCVVARFKLQKAATLLAYLALHAGRSHSRERLIDLLWPELSPESGRDNLSTTLSSLRRDLAILHPASQTLLLADRHCVGLNTEVAVTDVAEFDWLLRQARSAAFVADRSRFLEQAIALYRGDLLEGIYEEWALRAQHAYQQRYREALLDWTQDLETQQAWTKAREVAERAVACDPLQEDGVLILMRVLARQGQVARALEAFRTFAGQLRAELDAEPTGELREMMERLQRDPGALVVRPPIHRETFAPAAPDVLTKRSPEERPASGTPLPPTNLPQWLTPLIGRQREVDEIQRLLGAHRLLTLTGIGGCGKTRLALETGQERLALYRDGVWLVELASLADPALVPNTVAEALAVSEKPGKTLLQALIPALQERRLLLILDNCEHLLAACARFASQLLRACPRLTILATSREALTIAGEQTYRVPSLALPDPKQTLSVEALRRYGAIQLFVERAQLVRQEFQLTEQNAPALVSICQRLDGIPLAIELAAACARSLSMDELNRRLDDRFALLVRGDRTALPRQQTLRALIDWSYDLLSEPERRMLARLSVFAGGWTLAAAEAVTGEGEGALTLLVALVDKSLALAEEQEGGLRYRMLETVRQYASERLHSQGEAETMRGRHRDWYLRLAEEARGPLKTYQAEWLGRLEIERDNLRAALEWCAVEPEGAEPGLRMAGALPRFWDVRGHLAEGRECLERALERAKELPYSLRWVDALNGLSNLALGQGDYLVAQTSMEESLRISRALQDKWNIALCLGNLGNLAVTRGDYIQGKAFYQESLALSRELEDREGIGYTLHGLSDVAFHQGDLADAQALGEESLKIRREIDDRRGIAYSLTNLGSILYARGDASGAIRCFLESLAAYKELGEMWGAADVLFWLADVTADTGNMLPAAILCGAAAALRDQIGAPLAPSMRARSEGLQSRLEAALGAEACASARARGRAMDWEQVLQETLGERV